MDGATAKGLAKQPQTGFDHKHTSEGVGMHFKSEMGQMVIWNPVMCSQQRVRNKDIHLVYCLKEIWRSSVKFCFHLEHFQPCVLMITASSLTELPAPSSGPCVDQKMSHPIPQPFPKAGFSGIAAPFTDH